MVVFEEYLPAELTISVFSNATIITLSGGYFTLVYGSTIADSL